MPPLAVSVAVVCPTQIVPVLAVIAGNGFTVIVAVAIAVQVPIEPVTVYTVVPPGVPVTVEPVVALKPVAGVHE